MERASVDDRLATAVEAERIGVIERDRLRHCACALVQGIEGGDGSGERESGGPVAPPVDPHCPVARTLLLEVVAPGEQRGLPVEEDPQPMRCEVVWAADCVLIETTDERQRQIARLLHRGAQLDPRRLADENGMAHERQTEIGEEAVRGGAGRLRGRHAQALCKCDIEPVLERRTHLRPERR
ncbi:hypothetical protein NLM24_34770 [Nocardia zapadnayensis]|nr:hypothetical protein [Nocardia zapadnayensis]MCK1801507.1 hypothetical protein [Brevibacterium sp. R8603A2]MCX0275752.1 hypothetical protein [Nocardia zapadnayensis]